MAGHVARKGNRWYAIVYEGTDPATGRERRRWHAAGPDRAAAEALADQLATAHARRRTTARGMTVDAFIHRYWLPGKQRQLRPTTLESYQRILRLHILPALGHVTLRDLRVDHAETLYTHLLSAGRHDGAGGLSAESVHEVHMVLRAIGGHAVRHGLLPANPVRLATPPRFRRDHHLRRMAWTADELGHCLATSRDHVHHRAFWLAAHTGMRRGELMALRWRDIDIPAARLTVSRTAVCVGTTVSESGGKTPRAVRTVDLDPATLDVRPPGGRTSTTPSATSQSGCSPSLTGGCSTPRPSPRPSNGSWPAPS